MFVDQIILQLVWSSSLMDCVFLQAMHLVYRALEKEPVPSVLPSSLIPPSKRKKSAGSLPGMAPVLPGSPPPPKDSLRSTPSHGSMNSLNSAGSLSPKHTMKSTQVCSPKACPPVNSQPCDTIEMKRVQKTLVYCP